MSVRSFKRDVVAHPERVVERVRVGPADVATFGPVVCSRDVGRDALVGAGAPRCATRRKDAVLVSGSGGLWARVSPARQQLGLEGIGEPDTVHEAVVGGPSGGVADNLGERSVPQTRRLRPRR
jgi:hypothetical protein